MEQDRHDGARASRDDVPHVAGQTGVTAIVSWRDRRGDRCFETQKLVRAFFRVVGFWTDCSVFAYSIQNAVVDAEFRFALAPISGYAIQAIYDMDHGQLRLASVVLFVAVGVAAYQSIDLNFVNYDNDDPKYVYVYAHTRRGTLDLVKQVEQIAKENTGGLTGITIVSPDYWPLPWYFRNFTRVGYYGRMAASTEPIIIANENQKDEVETNFGELYRQVPSKEEGGSFELRPGVRLLLYVRRPGV